MKNFHYFLCTFALIIFFESTLHASEVYSIIYKKCLSYTGLIFDVDENEIQLLDKNGSFQVLQKKGIESVLIFNTVDNPIPRIDFKQSKSSSKKSNSSGKTGFQFHRLAYSVF